MIIWFHCIVTPLPRPRAAFSYPKPTRSFWRRCFAVGSIMPRLCEIRLTSSFDAQPSWTPLSENGPLHLACVGRLDIRAKGQDVLLEALARDAWLKRNWKLTLYGDGPTKAGIKSMISDLKLSDRVSIAGHVDHIDAIWRTNHVLVQPSRHEGLPLSVVEAMLCARPVIATKVGGHAEVVVEGATGFLADAATPNSIAEALERAWQARPYLDQLGKNGAERIRQIMPREPAQAFAEKLLALL